MKFDNYRRSVSGGACWQAAARPKASTLLQFLAHAGKLQHVPKPARFFSFCCHHEDSFAEKHSDFMLRKLLYEVRGVVHAETMNGEKDLKIGA